MRNKISARDKYHTIDKMQSLESIGSTSSRRMPESRQLGVSSTRNSALPEGVSSHIVQNSFKGDPSIEDSGSQDAISYFGMKPNSAESQLALLGVKNVIRYKVHNREVLRHQIGTSQKERRSREINVSEDV